MQARKLIFILPALMLVLSLISVTQAQESTPIEPGETINSALTFRDLEARYTFEGQAGDMFVIALNSDDFDAFLLLEGPNGNEVASDDDGGEGLNSRIGPFELPLTGTYTIVARSLSGEATGSYSISLQEAAVRRIEYTQSISQQLTDEMLTATFSFRGQEDDVIIISMESIDFDSFLALQDPDGFEIVSDDDGGSGVNSLIGPFTLPRTGNYVITARSLSSNDTGGFTLTLDRVILTPLPFDETVVAEFDERTARLFYTFDAPMGESINLIVRGDELTGLDTTLSLRGPSNFELTFDDDSGGGLNPEITGYILPQSGRYIVRLSAFSPGDTGAVELTLVRSEVASLDAGPVIVRLNDKRNEEVISFTAQAGQRYRLTLSEVNGVPGQPHITISQNEFTIVSGNASEVAGFAMEFETDSDGRTLINLSDFSFAQVTWEITLEALIRSNA